jgi:hypothetical protein
MKAFFGALIGFGVGSYVALGPVLASMSSGQRMVLAAFAGAGTVGLLWLINWLRTDPSRNSDYILAERERPNVINIITFDNSTHHTSYSSSTSYSYPSLPDKSQNSGHLTLHHRFDTPRRESATNRVVRVEKPPAGYLTDKGGSGERRWKTAGDWGEE